MKEVIDTLEKKKEAVAKIQNLVDMGIPLTKALKKLGYHVSVYYEWRKLVGGVVFKNKSTAPVKKKKKPKSVKSAQLIEMTYNAPILPVDPKVFMVYGTPEAVAATIARMQ